MKTKKLNKAKHNTLFTLLYCVDQYAVCVVWYLATTSVLVVGNVDMVEFLVPKDSMSTSSRVVMATCRGIYHSPVPLSRSLN